MIKKWEEENKVKKFLKAVGSFVKRHKKVVIIISIVIIIALVALVVLNIRKKDISEIAAANQMETVALEKRNLSKSVSVTGIIESADSRSISTDLNDIEITNVNVEIGDTVKAGDVICEFNTEEIEQSLEDSKTSLGVSESETSISISAAQRSLAEAQETQSIESEREDDSVNEAYSKLQDAISDEDEALTTYQEAQDDTSDKKVARADAKEASDKAKEAKAEAKDTYEKELDILNAMTSGEDTTEQDNIVSEAKTEYENASTAYDTAKDAYTTAKAAYTAAVEAEVEPKSAYEDACDTSSTVNEAYDNAVEQRDDTNRNNESNVANQQDSVSKAKLSATTSNTSNKTLVQNYEKQMNKSVVTAPRDGVVTSVSVETGDIYTGGEIVVIQDCEQFIVEAPVDEYDISDISEGLDVVVKTDATGDEELNGIISFVPPTADVTTSSSTSTSATYTIKINLVDTNERLRVGMTAKTSILLDSRENVFAVPYDCIQTNANGDSVIYVIDNSALSENMDISNETGNVPREQNTSEDLTIGDANNTKPEVDTTNGKSAGRANQVSGNGQLSGVTTNQKEIIVEEGMESDYYVEISSDELTERMQVVMESSTTNSTNSNKQSSILGGGNMGGMRGGF
jgi:multidrug efflux pump subunit AcrA (membrane-fusion protein)